LPTNAEIDSELMIYEVFIFGILVVFLFRLRLLFQHL